MVLMVVFVYVGDIILMLMEAMVLAALVMVVAVVMVGLVVYDGGCGSDAGGGNVDRREFCGDIDGYGCVGCWNRDDGGCSCDCGGGYRCYDNGVHDDGYGGGCRCDVGDNRTDVG